MTQVKAGDKVRMHYTGTLEDGTTFDSSAGREPLEFTVGSGEIIPGLDNAVPGMVPGDTKKVTVPPTEAYGEHDPARAQTVPRDQIPDHIPTEVGTQLQLQTPDGQTVPVVVADVNEAEVTLDANHPLAGKALVFDVELVEIV
ncbi:FKBP-type peptidyl-prolyl cis-trans isomerase [Anianabacter salinae]|uniref:FKBP-type peptidyl-prolyl cis-trans isomerase n=1 Tax=Anianabacter salinae TaxID=2851023 RepID=UPI00225DD5CD|nr:peptidylprolyl isomerase [Anianabacter salinae]MBV0912712.1 peptidylprolyl isomerase [Anianabacter salinae]